jgi:hypothetical protein
MLCGEKGGHDDYEHRSNNKVGGHSVFSAPSAIVTLPSHGFLLADVTLVTKSRVAELTRNTRTEFFRLHALETHDSNHIDHPLATLSLSGFGARAEYAGAHGVRITAVMMVSQRVSNRFGNQPTAGRRQLCPSRVNNCGN